MSSLLPPECSPANKKVLVVDSYLSVANLLAMFIRQAGYYEVVGEAATGTQGLAVFRQCRPNLVITSLELGEIGGTEMIAEMRAEVPEVRILIYTGSRKQDLVYDVLDADPQGFVHKTEGLEILQQGVEMVVQGMTYRSPHMTHLLDQKRQEALTGVRLTVQERNVVKLIALGKRSKEIATLLCLSLKTVENYRSTIMSKVGLEGIADLTRFAFRRGIVE